jgi:hypothetical protein
MDAGNLVMPLQRRLERLSSLTRSSQTLPVSLILIVQKPAADELQ